MRGPIGVRFIWKARKEIERMLKKLVEELERLQYNKCASLRPDATAVKPMLLRYWGDEEAKIRTRKINDKSGPKLIKLASASAVCSNRARLPCTMSCLGCNCAQRTELAHSCYFECFCFNPSFPVKPEPGILAESPTSLRVDVSAYSNQSMSACPRRLIGLQQSTYWCL